MPISHYLKIHYSDCQTFYAKSRTAKYMSINQLWDIGLSDAALEKLADADAFRSVGLDRRQALWQVSAKDTPEVLFAGRQSEDEKRENISLPEMAASEHVMHDYAATSLSLKAHPVSFVREKLRQLHVLSTVDLKTAKDGQPVKVAGLVLIRQRPGTAGGICFMTIEDEHGVANIVIFNNLFDKYRKEILQSKLLMVEGSLQIQGEVIHVIAQCLYDFSKLFRKLTKSKDEMSQGLTFDHTAASDNYQNIPAGQNKRSQIRENVQEKVFPEARNFK